MKTLLAELAHWEAFARTLDPLAAGLKDVTRKIENLRLVISARSKKESE